MDTYVGNLPFCRRISLRESPGRPAVCRTPERSPVIAGCTFGGIYPRKLSNFDHTFWLVELLHETIMIATHTQISLY